MYSADGLVLGVVQKKRYAVGRAHADTHLADVRRQRIDAFECRLPLDGAEAQEVFVDGGYPRLVCLMGHDEAFAADAQQLAERLAVLSDGLRIVAAVGVDVKLAVCAMTVTTVARRTEGHHAGCPQVVVVQEGSFHE